MNKQIKLLCWNVNGIRAVERKGFLEWVRREKPDILCVQETKARQEQLAKKLLDPDDYKSYWHSADVKKGGDIF